MGDVRSEERAALADGVRRVLADHGGAAYARARSEDPARGSDPAWESLAALGVTGLLAPGSEVGMVEAGAVAEELGRVASPLPWISTAITAGSALALGGDPDGLLARLADGGSIGTLALLEPGSRYRWRSPSTAAVGGRLSGTKVHVPALLAADVVLVTGRDDDGLGLWAVERPADVRPGAGLDGSRPTGTLVLHATPGRRLPLRGDHTALVAQVLDRTVAALVADGVGAAGRAFELSLEHAKTRHQFGRPVGSFQAVQHLCVDAFESLVLARTACAHALRCLDEEDPTEAHRAVVMAKACASAALPRVGSAAVAVFAGIGFTWEHDVGLLYKRLLSLATLHGGESEQLAELGALVLGPTLTPA